MERMHVDGRRGRPAASFPWLAAALFLLPFWAAPARAEDEPPKQAAEEDPLEVCDDAKAKELSAELGKVGKQKDGTGIMPVLEKIEGLRHEEFEKPLLKLLKHDSGLVALKVAEMWEWRVHKKNASKLWKASWDEKKNDKRFTVTATVLKGYARAGLEIGDREFKDIERAWRWIVGNPDPAMSPALVAIAEYAKMAKDKRLYRPLAEELDEPGTNVSASDPNNPPQEWWERRWKLWKESKPAVVAALLALTGKEFDKTAAAKAWLEENAKTFGVKW